MLRMRILFLAITSDDAQMFGVKFLASWPIIIGHVRSSELYGHK